MMDRSLSRQLGILLLSFFVLTVALLAQLSKEDHQAAQKMISGTLYLRVQVPYKYGVGHWAPYSDSMLEASPSELNTDRKLAVPLEKNQEIYWGYLANTPVRYGKLVAEKGRLVVWMERVDPNTEVSVDFININSLDDFTKAFNLSFSKVPLQNEHPEWPSDVRDAIAAGKVVAGMTVDQARIVAGAPLSVSSGDDHGAKTETWQLRQNPGRVIGWNKKKGAWKKVSTQTGLPTSITFKDGRLAAIEGGALAQTHP